MDFQGTEEDLQTQIAWGKQRGQSVSDVLGGKKYLDTEVTGNGDGGTHHETERPDQGRERSVKKDEKLQPV